MYCSNETRKVLDCLDQYGLEVLPDDKVRVEQAVGRFWNTHIQKVITDIMSKGDAAKRMSKIDEVGVWPYFEKPILSMLTPRGAAARTDTVDFTITPHVAHVYSLVCRSFVLADFNMKELALLAGEIPSMVPDVGGLAQAMEASRRQGQRSIYYLHGVIKREYQTREGRIKEIQQRSAEAGNLGWQVPDSFDRMDITERRSLDADWKDRLNSINIAKALNNATS